MFSCKALVLGLALVGYALAYTNYRDMIPNGYKVPNPCGKTQYWEAVGHYHPLHHTDDKNAFGRDFAAERHRWTDVLCKKDSDGDGRTNGQELGDPHCVWSPGATPARAATGHPGICEPLGSCPSSTFTCGCQGHSCVVG